MGEETRSTPTTASPWPLLVALGVAVSEVGVVLALFPVAVAGLLLFAGSVAGILGESGYADSPWPVMTWIGAALAVAGVVVYVAGGGVLDASGVAAALGDSGSTPLRGLAIVAAGVLAVVVSVAGRRWGAERVDPWTR